MLRLRRSSSATAGKQGTWRDCSVSDQFPRDERERMEVRGRAHALLLAVFALLLRGVWLQRLFR